MRLIRLLPIFALAGAAVGLMAQSAFSQASSSYGTSHARAASRLKYARSSGTPKPFGSFGDWTAVIRTEAGRPECYTFTRPLASAPTLPSRGDVFFTITESAKLRDSVALTAGFAYPAGAEAAVTVGNDKFDFYTSGRSAFARDGAALITSFAKGSDATVVSPTRGGGSVTDHFSLTGFSAAMKAVLAKCPGK